MGNRKCTQFTEVNTRITGEQTGQIRYRHKSVNGGQKNKKGDPDRQISDRVSCIKSGSFLLSHLPAVPSAQVSLTSLFGMGRGGSSPLLPPQYRSGNRSFSLVKPRAECFGILVQVDFGVTAFTSPAYLRRSLRRPSAKSHPGDGFALRCFQRLS